MALDNQGQFRAMEDSILADYYVVLSRAGDPAVWQWEIHRRSRPLGVRLYGAGFVSQTGARLAGETARCCGKWQKSASETGHRRGLKAPA